MSKTARILIAGAGVGGLALAQALHHGGLEVAVHEQDPTPRIRHQGFRIHIDENGDRALRSCLPAATFELVRQSSGTNDDVVGMYTEQLDPVLTQTFPGITDELITNVDRNTLRHGLLTGLGDIVHFGHEVRGYRHTDSGRVRVEFADGTADEADLLIGADGVGSAVRRQLLPHAGVRDLGVRCLYGRMTLTEVTRALIPPAVERGFSWVSDNAGCGAGFAPVRFRRPPAGASDYLMITLLATPNTWAYRTSGWPSSPPGSCGPWPCRPPPPGIRRCGNCSRTPTRTPSSRSRCAPGSGSAPGRRARSPCSAMPSTPCRPPAGSARTPRCGMRRPWPANCSPPRAGGSR